MSYDPKVVLKRIQPADVDGEIRRMPQEIWSPISAQSALRDLNEGNQSYYAVIWEGKRVGIVGHETTIKKLNAVSLMFSGILPEYRKKGLFRSAMAELEAIIASEFPSAELIREVGPMRIKTVFVKLGYTLIDPGSETTETVLHKRIVR